MYKIGICGHFSDENKKFNGQTVKTKILAEALREIYQSEQMIYVDTKMFHKHAIGFFCNCYKLLKNCENIIILPAQSAINILVPFFSIFNRLFNRKLHYYVVGGWICSLLKERWLLLSFLRSYSGIYVELQSMKFELQELGLTNIILVGKFRDIKFLSYEEVDKTIMEPHKLCFYSRVLKDKGIEDAISAVNSVNRLYSRIVYSLDIYGPIDEEYRNRFSELISTFPDYIKYLGILDYHESNIALKNYFAMVFPTIYQGEGYPNVVVDAFSAGLPVIATDWKYIPQVINDGEDGYLYGSQDKDGLEKVLVKILEDPIRIITMKEKVCKRSDEFKPAKAIQPLIDMINRV